MYRKVDDFIRDWNYSAAGTLKVIEALEDDKLDQAIVEGHNTLGWLSSHLVDAPSFFGGLAGLDVPSIPEGEKPTTVKELEEAYKKKAAKVEEEATKLSDHDLERRVEAFGKNMPVGQVLRSMIDHQTHHRGQMTVLIRQAELPVPPIMGPTIEQA
ncbi:MULTISPECIES: DinB family protein [Kurthia]|uniref:DinB family protein n=1 Tax=Kurthia TaxID=1649 RepID=UPI0011415FF7|nr:DinB family protein [Kurthia gibsonii]GED18886.1 hypothetical protein KGI01_06270 [Kurthia gibsonii]